MRVGGDIDQLGVDAELVARPPDAPFEHIAHTQLPADLSRVDGLVPVVNAVLREMTSIPGSRDRSVVTSSVIPSAKYCCSRSSLRFVKGRTTIDRRGAATGGEPDGLEDTLPAG